jgi:hypothetical protein
MEVNGLVFRKVLNFPELRGAVLPNLYMEDEENFFSLEVGLFNLLSKETYFDSFVFSISLCYFS